MKVTVILLLTLYGCSRAAIFRNDYLPVGHVRTDPILSQTCLSDHVHTFYGPPLLYPAVTYEDLRASDPEKSSGNAKENLSLYWHPAVYRIEDADGTKTLVDSNMTSLYYEYIQNETSAFPAGFRMIGVEPIAAEATCVDPEPCTRDYCGPATNNFFPLTSCSELEVSMEFPHCWDGETLDDPRDQRHMAPALGDGFVDDRCPDSHPVRLPKIAFFFRVFNYPGGPHEFSDGSGIFHADYIAGWDEAFLQNVLDNCNEEEDAAQCDVAPFTYRGNVFYQGTPEGDNDLGFVEKLRSIAVPLVDNSCITPEAIDGVANLPRGTCNGRLISPIGVCPEDTTIPPPDETATVVSPDESTTSTSPDDPTTTLPPNETTTDVDETSSTTLKETTSTTDDPVDDNECIVLKEECDDDDICCDGAECIGGVCSVEEEPNGNDECIELELECDDDDICCEGAECLNGACMLEDEPEDDCIDLNEHCDDDDFCCEGAGECVSGVCTILEESQNDECIELEDHCDDDDVCCEGECIDEVCIVDGEPTYGNDCVEHDEECGFSDFCCDGECIDGICSYELDEDPDCSQIEEKCDEDEDIWCCEGECIDGTCVEQDCLEIGEECEFTDLECCEGSECMFSYCRDIERSLRGS